MVQTNGKKRKRKGRGEKQVEWVLEGKKKKKGAGNGVFPDLSSLSWNETSKS